MDQRLIDLIVSSAEKLGYEGARIWPQMVMITFVQALYWLILGPVLVVLSVLGFSWFWRQREAARASMLSGIYRADDTIGMDIIVLFSGLAVVVLTIIVVITLPSTLTGVFYPEATTVLKLAHK